MVRFPYLAVESVHSQGEVLTEELWAHGAIGIEERDEATLLTAREGHVLYIAHFADAATAKQAQQALSPRYEVTLEYVVGDAWRDEWKRFFRPQHIGRLLVRPSWEQVTPESGEIELVLDPGRAFGTGRHASTRLLLQVLESTVHADCSVLDVGCGSGILSIAALLLGAKRAVGLDIDPDAIGVALQNAADNGVGARFSANCKPLNQLPAGSYDIVVANIEAPVHLALVNDLIARVSADGVLMLSGLLLQDETSVRHAFGALDVVQREVEGEWLALCFKRLVSKQRPLGGMRE